MVFLDFEVTWLTCDCNRFRCWILPHQLGPLYGRREGVRHSDRHHGRCVPGLHRPIDDLGQEAQGSAGTLEVHHELDVLGPVAAHILISQVVPRLLLTLLQDVRGCKSGCYSITHQKHPVPVVPSHYLAAAIQNSATVFPQASSSGMPVPKLPGGEIWL